MIALVRPPSLPGGMRVTHMELGEPAPAVAPLQKVLAAQPDNVQARQMLAQALLELERWDAAAAQFRALTGRAP